MNITTTYDEAMVKAMIVEAVAKERNSWPAEMEAMERQVNILTDALAQAKAEEREACAQILDEMADDMVREMEPSTEIAYVRRKAAAMRARGENT
jgi:vacuolar-type H+-ATPase subunit E/Vma4